jgi:4-amino-4-deoxy-L-arabinose transferase-like glycosyltransferase
VKIAEHSTSISEAGDEPLNGGGTESNPADRRSRVSRFLNNKFAFWRSPPGQPTWARPILLAIGAMAGLSYGWGMSNFPLEPFYAAAVRSMGSSWRDFFYGAVDPAGTVTLDKLPGAFWVQALSVRLFGFHYWAVALPQVLAGILTVFVLYRAVRTLAGPKAGLVAALILAASPVTILLNRGNVSDSILVLLTVLAADATSRAVCTGRLRTLMLAGLWVGLGFQTKMVQAWLILPVIFVTYLVAAPLPWRRRIGQVAMAAGVALVVSLSWMSVVALIPAHNRPYVDGTTDDSVYTQVFVYNGWFRIGIKAESDKIVHGAAPFLLTLQRNTHDVGTYRIPASPTRLLTGPFGRDDAWLLPAALLSLLVIFLTRRRTPRTDLIRAAALFWGCWLIILFGFFSGGAFINSYYTAALIPAVAALCAIGLALAWRSRITSRVSRMLLMLVVPLSTLYAVELLPSWNNFGWWMIPLALLVAAAAELVLFLSVRGSGGGGNRGGISIPLAAVSILLVPAITSAIVVSQGLGSFSTPYQSASVTQGTTTGPELFQSRGAAVAASLKYYPASAYLQGIDTSYLASQYIMITGREFLPIGGYAGVNPSPSLAELKSLVKSGKLETFFIPVQPAGDDPRLGWIRSHCTTFGAQPIAPGVRFSLYACHGK